MAASGTINLSELAAQVIKLGDEVQQLRLDNATLQGQVAALKAGGGGDNKSSGKSVLRDFKKLYPEKFAPKSDSFVSWSETLSGGSVPSLLISPRRLNCRPLARKKFLWSTASTCSASLISNSRGFT